MKHFQSKLHYMREQFPSAKEFAKRTGLSEGTISRLLSGKGDPDDETLRALCESLGEERGADLLSGYLYDRVPKQLRRYIKITPTYRFKTVETQSLHDLLSRLPQRWTDMLTRAGRICLEDDQAGEAIEPIIELLSALYRRTHR